MEIGHKVEKTRALHLHKALGALDRLCEQAPPQYRAELQKVRQWWIHHLYQPIHADPQGLKFPPSDWMQGKESPRVGVAAITDAVTADPTLYPLADAVTPYITANLFQPAPRLTHYRSVRSTNQLAARHKEQSK
jgi:hypothetical protein